MNNYCSEGVLSITSVSPGDELPVLHKQPNQIEVVQFCAAIRNFHRFHYDQAYIRDQGFDDLIIPGFMLGNWCIEAASRAFVEPLQIQKLSFKNTAAALIGPSYKVMGQVDSVETNEASIHVACRFEVIDENNKTVTVGKVDLVSVSEHLPD